MFASERSKRDTVRGEKLKIGFTLLASKLSERDSIRGG